MVKFIFWDENKKVHTKTSKAGSCRYAYEFVNGKEKLVVRDYFTNKVINCFTIPWNWTCIRVEA